MPPGMLVATTFLNPTYAAKLLESETGIQMLWAAAIWQFLGMLIIRKIVNIKV
jgi:Flp pilus assembly protein TadB